MVEEKDPLGDILTVQPLKLSAALKLIEAAKAHALSGRVIMGAIGHDQAEHRGDGRDWWWRAADCIKRLKRDNDRLRRLAGTTVGAVGLPSPVPSDDELGQVAWRALDPHGLTWGAVARPAQAAIVRAARAVREKVAPAAPSPVNTELLAAAERACGQLRATGHPGFASKLEAAISAAKNTPAKSTLGNHPAMSPLPPVVLPPNMTVDCARAAVAQIEALLAARGSELSPERLAAEEAFLAGLKKTIRTAATAAPSGEPLEARGTFACPICGSETPHYHSDEVTEAWREDERRADGWTSVSVRAPKSPGFYLCSGHELEGVDVVARAVARDRNERGGFPAEVLKFSPMYGFWLLQAPFIGSSMKRRLIFVSPRLWRPLPAIGAASASISAADPPLGNHTAPSAVPPLDLSPPVPYLTQINALGCALRRVLVADCVLREDAGPSGPELIAAAEHYIEHRAAKAADDARAAASKKETP